VPLFPIFFFFLFVHGAAPCASATLVLTVVARRAA